MKKQNEFDYVRTLRKLINVSLETAVEIIDKKGPLAFINNGFTILSLGGELDQLANEFIYIKDHPELVEALLKDALKKYPKHADDIIIKTFNKIYSAIVFDISTALSIAEDWKEYNSRKEE